MKTNSTYVKNFALIALALLSQGANAAYTLNVAPELSSPPEPHSKSEFRDYKILHEWEVARTLSDCKLADTQSMMNIEAFFGPRTKLTSRAEFEAVTPVLKELFETAVREVEPFKQKYHRPRPYTMDASLKPCISMPKGSTSYPSAHAAVGELMGKVLADLFPKRAKEFTDQGIKIGTNRVLGGVHYPSDVLAARALADQVYQTIQKNNVFRKDFADAKNSLE